MIHLLLAIASSATLSIIMRASEKRISGNVSMLAVNYLACMLLAGAYMGFENIMPRTQGIGMAAGLGLVNGILYLSNFILLQFNIKKNGVVLSTTFMKLGLLVPMVLSVFVFGEMPGVLQIIGFVLALVAIVLINYEKEESVMGFKAGLIILLLMGGITDAMSKVYERYGSGDLSNQFLFYTFAVAFVLCSLLAFYKRERPGLGEVVFGLLIGVPNYFSARFLLKALENLPAVLVYPTYSVATIIVVTLAGCLFFRERLGRKQWIGMAAILAALVMLNV